MSQISEWFGEGTCRERRSRIEAFWKGSGRCIVTVTPEPPTLREGDDDARLLAQAVEFIRRQAALPGVNLPQFVASFSSGPEAYWGATVATAADGINIRTMPAAATLHDALSLAPRPLEDPALNAARTLRVFSLLREELQSDELWLRLPSTHGALGTACRIVEQMDLLPSLLSDPSAARLLLRRLNRFLVAYLRYLRTGSGGMDCGMIWPYTFLPSNLGVAIVEDHMPLVSPSVFRDIALPALRHLGRTFCGLQVHCCGSWGRHVDILAGLGTMLRAVEFHFPFTRIEQIAALARRVVLIPYICLELQGEFGSRTEYYRHLLASTPEHCRFWFALPDDSEESIRFARDLGF
jgi:hypothetical protein